MGLLCTHRLLLLMGANPSSTDARGYTPLHVSAHSRNEESSSLLLQNGASPNQHGHSPEFYQTPFHRARSEGVVKAFLQNGGNAFAPLLIENQGVTKQQSVLDVLLEKQPQSAIELLEDGISTNDEPMDSNNVLVIFDYELFYRQGVMDKVVDNANPNQRENGLNNPATATITEPCDEMAVHRQLLRHDTGDLLKHPLSESFLHIKWQLTRTILYANLLYFMSFVIVLTSETVFEAHLLKCNVTSSNDTGDFNFYSSKYLSC